MQKNLRLMKQEKRNKRLCKWLSVVMVILMLFSSALLSVSAAYNSWGLDTSQADIDYFYAVGYGGSPYPAWSVIRQKCFNRCKDLVNAFNRCVVDTNENFNMIAELEYCYSNGCSNEAADIGNRWNILKANINDLVEETSQLVGHSGTVPTLNGGPVTTEQYQNLFNEITKQYDVLNSLMEEIRSLYSYAKTAQNVSTGNLLNNSTSLVNKLWSLLGGMIIDFGTGNGSTGSIMGIAVSSYSIQQAANALSAILKTFAYAVAVILFGVNITTTSLQNEILTLRGGIKVFARVILVKFWIDLAIPICIYVLNIINSLTNQIMAQLNVTTPGDVLSGSFSYNPSAGSGGFFNAVVGYLKSMVELFTSIAFGSPLIILLIVMMVCVVIVMVKLVARVLELTCLVAVAPVFFATLVGEESKRYFRKFFSAFLSTAAYIIFVAITYAVATKWVANSTPATFSSPFMAANVVVNFINVLPRAIIIIACCRVVVKPPRVLTSLIDA